MITERTKAILLFTSYFGKQSDRSIKPLNTREWNKFVRWMGVNSLTPEQFLTSSFDSLLEDWKDDKITKERISELLDRRALLALSFEKWIKIGIWVIHRGDQEYPKKLKEKLKDFAPPVLFGVGDKDLLNKKYVGVVGSRKVDEGDLGDAQKIALSANENSYGIVSGGAKGVDESAMLGVLELGGFCLGFVSDSLIRKSSSKIFRRYISENRLCLLSPFNPEAGFNVGNAMARNKYIYAQSDFTIVVKSDIKGGTWEGANENLKKRWTPLWVLDKEEKGNKRLIALGANQLSMTDKVAFETLTKSNLSINGTLSLFAPTQSNTEKAEINKNLSTDDNTSCKEIEVRVDEASLFDFFLLKLSNRFKGKTVTKDEIKENLDITNSQLNEWLKIATEQDFIIKKTRPVSFEINPNKYIKVVA